MVLQVPETRISGTRSATIQQSMYFLLISHPSNLSITRRSVLENFLLGHPRMMYQFSDTFYAFNQSRPLNPVNPGGSRVGNCSLDSLILLCSIPGERFIGNFLIYLKGQLILKTYATVTPAAFGSFHFYSRKTGFFIS